MEETFYFHDYETFGTDPGQDWPAQFAGVRTDADFREIGTPLVEYCRLPGDRLPDPEACLITGITPQQVEEKGLRECEFIDLIHQQMSQPGTCSLGYNSIRFDDEVTRHCLYRNFHDPYAREWMNSCSRWDLIDVTRLCAALRPDGIVWPRREDGSHCFRLERLTQANGITHDHAHDALSDVRATIAWARLLRKTQPRLFAFALNHRSKWRISSMLDTISQSPAPLIHVSGKYPASRHCLAMIAPLATHPLHKNKVIVCDLSADPGPLLSESSDVLRERLFTPGAQLQEQGLPAVPLKAVHLNRTPALAPCSALHPADWNRLGISKTLCSQHYGALFSDRQTLSNLRAKIAEIYKVLPESDPDDNRLQDPDQMLYCGGFFSAADKKHIAKVAATAPDKLGDLSLAFGDARLPEMLFRYRARNWPEWLSQQETTRWEAFRLEQIKRGAGGHQLPLHDWIRKTETLLQTETRTECRETLKQLWEYGNSIKSLSQPGATNEA